MLVTVFSLPVGVQMHGENAPSQLILYHYPDLKQEKGVVLMTAEMDPKFIVSPPPSAFTCVASSGSNTQMLSLFPDRPPGPVLGQSGAAVLRHAEAGDVPVGRAV